MPGDFDFDSDEPKPKRRPRDDENDREERPKKRRREEDEDDPPPKSKRDSYSDDNPFANEDAPPPAKKKPTRDEPRAKKPTISDDNPFADEPIPPVTQGASETVVDNPFADEPASTKTTKRRRNEDEDDERTRRRRDRDDESDRRPRRQGDKPKSSTPIFIALGILGLLVIGGLVTTIVILVTGNNKEPTKEVAKANEKDKGSSKATTKTEPEKPLDKKDSTANSIPKPLLEKTKRNTVFIRVLFAGGVKGGSGSGFVERDSKLIITNAHVLGDIKRKFREPEVIELTFNSGEKNEYKLFGRLRGLDQATDLAAVEPLRNPDVAVAIPEGISLARNQKLELLQQLFIFGFPLGDDLGTEISVNPTQVSSIRKDSKQIQVNGGMTFGNSGGPVVDAKGNVVGVAVAIIKDTNINFAIPSDAVHDFLTREKLR